MATKPKKPDPKAPDAKAASAKAASPKAAKPKTMKPKDDGDGEGASTSRIVLMPIEARYIGDQLRGIAYLAKKLALAIREKGSPTPFHPDQVKEISDAAYALADRLRLAGDDGSNGG